MKNQFTFFALMLLSLTSLCVRANAAESNQSDANYEHEMKDLVQRTTTAICKTYYAAGDCVVSTVDLAKVSESDQTVVHVAHATLKFENGAKRAMDFDYKIENGWIKEIKMN